MNETAERRQGAENACQRLRRRVLTATAALAAAALVFGWLAAGAPFQVYAIQSRGLATPGQAWQALTG